ncbi:head GIN domain-containing protein [Stakelama saccharophila]|uniref:Head GIN domain-containing protein n=1 Tax=Stakelama saccharophila TaxID=3075605 RepID=A0ABZ0BAG4_9SPHN|nr:head GIN domain-containing protein [Stakelama sp. W311]WNO54270.1 head GIN domain-containing protein [Stakelama sp. W311]
MRVLTALTLLSLAACSGTSEATANKGGYDVAEGSSIRQFPARDFAGVALLGSDDVDISTGQDFSVRAEGGDEALDRLKIEVRDHVLRIGHKDTGWSWGSHEGAVIHVTMPAIRTARISGSGNMTIDRAEGPFEGSIAGSGDLTVGAVDGPSAEFDIAGSGTLSAAGRVDRLSMAIDGSGDIKAGGLTARQASVEIAGSGDATAAVNGNANVSVLGSGDVDLGGQARCTINSSGSGDVHCGG